MSEQTFTVVIHDADPPVDPDEVEQVLQDLGLSHSLGSVEVKDTAQQADALIEYALQGARPAMRKRRVSFDGADEIAEGIALGIKRGLVKLGLTDDEGVKVTSARET